LASDEAKRAFTRAQELATDVGNVAERFDTYYGRWLTSLRRAELRSAQEIGETFRREAETLGRLTEVAVADRLLGLTALCQGDFSRAKEHLDEALRIYDPERDHETKFRFGLDTGFGAVLYLASTTLMLGGIEQARKLVEESVAQAVKSDHVPELLNAYLFQADHEITLGHAEAALRAVEALHDICKNRQTENWGVLQSAWARARLGDRNAGIAELKRALAAKMNENDKLSVPVFQGRLAEMEAEQGDVEDALTRIDEALALARETGIHARDAFLHRLRGEILLKRNPTDPAPLEEAYRTAIAIAKQQGARSYELLAALPLARLYQSTRRPIEAHAVLAPALEGFSPTPEMPEIAEAQALLEHLARASEEAILSKDQATEG
jgi:tetratricopeptide (TPR) repeat protein